MTHRLMVARNWAMASMILLGTAMLLEVML